MSDTRPIALLAAMPLELAPLCHQLALTRIDKQTHQGSCLHHNLITHVTGIGADRAIAAADRIIARYQPHTIIHLGLAGGLNPNLVTGSVLPIRTLLADHAAPPITLDIPGASNTPTTSATLLTTSKPVTTVADKARLHQTTGADAVDMETYPMAKHLAGSGIRLIALRAISDPAHLALPENISHTLNPDGSPNLPGALKLILKNPTALFTLAKLGRDSKRAATNLATAVTDLLKSNTFNPA